MTDEWQEFQAYTHFPRYAAAHKRDTSFLGRFTLEMLLDMNKGFAQVFTILARGYLFHEKDGTLVHDPYDRIGYARMALCAWCSAPKNAEGTAQVDFRELHGLFPELVTADGKGWFYRHVKNVISFVKAHPNDVKKQTMERCSGMSNGFTKEWKKHVKQRRFMIPFFLVMAAALVLIVGLWNGVRAFWPAYWQALLFLEVMNWYDGVVIDRLWVGHSRFWIIPGTEDIPFVQTWPQVLKKRGILTLIWLVGAIVVAGIVVLLGLR